MASSLETERKSTTAAEATLAKALAPEDVRRGDFVTPLYVVAEVPSYWWFEDNWSLPRNQPIRIRLTPPGEGAPLKVRSVCLPFVLVKSATQDQRTIDLRNCQLARLDRQHAKRAWKAFKKAARRSKAAVARL
jgi:hypothetical protein